jgi:hypothetical protein
MSTRNKLIISRLTIKYTLYAFKLIPFKKKQNGKNGEKISGPTDGGKAQKTFNRGD